MRINRILTVAFCTFSICFSGETNHFFYTKSYSGIKLNVENGSSEITLDSLQISGIAGDLKLPHELVRLVVPAGKVIDTIIVESRDSVIAIPFPVAEVESSELNGIAWKDGRGSTCRSTIEIVNQSRCGGIEIASLRINPIAMQDSLTCSVLRDLTVKVQFADNFYWKPSPVVSINAIAGMNLLNREAVYDYNKMEYSRAASATYLCITSQSMVDAIAEYTIHDLVALRQQQGLSAKILTVEDIERGYSGVDLQEKIRNAIKDHYENSGTAYVFIAGDQNVVPSRFLITAVTSTGPERFQVASDLYYQCLDGSFNEDGDNHYGEMSSDGPAWNTMDFYPELAIGRAPAEDFVELSNFIAKTIHWESASASSPQFRNLLLAGEYLGFTGDMVYGKPSVEELRIGTDKGGVSTEGIATNSSMTFESLYDMDRDESSRWSKKDILEKINSDRFGAIAHVGHGLTSSGLHMINRDIYNMGNKFPLFFYSEACVIGRMEEKAILEDMLTATENGFWGAMGNSGYGCLAPPSTYGPTHLLHRMFWHAAFRKVNSIKRVGDIAAEMHRLTADIQLNNLPYCHYETTLWADPATPLRLGSEDSEFFIITPHSKSRIQTLGEVFVTWRDDINETVKLNLLSKDGSVIALSEAIPSTGSSSFVLPENVDAGTYSLVIQGNMQSDTSDTFTITTQESSIEILAPVSEEKILVNENYEISWSGTESESVSLVLCRDNQQDIVITENVTGGSFNWIPKETISQGNDYRIAVISSKNPGSSNLSDLFSIGGVAITEFPWSESFDSFELGTILQDRWYQGENDALQWQVHTGPTPRREKLSSSPLTGAPGDHTGNDGNYLFIESDDASCMLKIGNLFTPSFDLSTLKKPKLSLWYHMYSKYNTMGALYIAIAQNGMIDTILTSKVRDQGDLWQQLEVDLSHWEGDTIQLIFQGLTGEDVNSDICIDDIAISGDDAVALVKKKNIANKYDVALSINPVPVDHSELKLYFKNTTKDYNIKIFDVVGNELFNQVGIGSVASWNLRNYQGKRVSGLCKVVVSFNENDGSKKLWYSTVGVKR